MYSQFMMHDQKNIKLRTQRTQNFYKRSIINFTNTEHMQDRGKCTLASRNY